MTWIGTLALVLTLVGAINWGLVGATGIDVLNLVSGGQTQYEPTGLGRILYGLVGLSGLVVLLSLFQGG